MGIADMLKNGLFAGATVASGGVSRSSSRQASIQRPGSKGASEDGSSYGRELAVRQCLRGLTANAQEDSGDLSPVMMSGTEGADPGYRGEMQVKALMQGICANSLGR